MIGGYRVHDYDALVFPPSAAFASGGLVLVGREIVLRVPRVFVCNKLWKKFCSVSCCTAPVEFADGDPKLGDTGERELVETPRPVPLLATVGSYQKKVNTTRTH